MAVPKVIKNFNLFVDGFGMAGLCDEVKMPDLKIKTEDHRAGGMDAPMRLDMGMEPIELGFTMAEHHRIIMRQFGLINQNAVAVTFRAAKVDDNNVDPYIITARGMYTQQQLGSVKNGDKTKLEATLSCRYFKVVLIDELIYEIDVDNMIRNIGGVDQMAAIRRAIGM